MLARATVRLGLTPDILRAALHDPDLRGLQASWLTTNAGKWAFLVTNLVFAYQAGGAAAVGVLGIARFLPPTLLAPLSGVPTTRWRPERVLVAVTALRAVAVGLTAALVVLDGPLAVLLALVALEAAAGAFGRPLHMALLPLLARTPGELVAANVASSAAEGIGTFVGPALGGLLLSTTGFGGAHLGVLAVYALGVAAMSRLTVPPVGSRDGPASSIRHQLSAGGRAIVALRAPRLLVLGILAQTTVRGALIVLTVIAAIEYLGMGEPGVGLLNAALGAGGIAGAAAAIALAGSQRLAPWFSVALAGWGVPIALIGLTGEPAIALGLMFAVGVSNAVLDVSGFTLLQRTTPNAARVAVLGLVDSLANGGQVVGGVMAPVLVAWLGIETALVLTGLSLPLVAALTWPAMRHIDDDAVVDTVRLERIRADPLFAPLSMAVVEQLAGHLTPVSFTAGDWVMREGEAGDHYFLIADGLVEVSNAHGPLGEMGPGQGVGEIALLRDVPRTASVRAVTDVATLALERPAFLEAVTGHPVSRTAADAVVAQRLQGGSTRGA